MADKTLDLKGLACPLPILKTKKALSELSPGGKLETQDLNLSTGRILEQAGILTAWHTDDWITDSRLMLRMARDSGLSIAEMKRRNELSRMSATQLEAELLKVDWDAVFADGGDFGNDQNRLWINQGGSQGGALGTFVDVTAAHLLEQVKDMLAERHGFLIFSQIPASLPARRAPMS